MWGSSRFFTEPKQPSIKLTNHGDPELGEKLAHLSAFQSLLKSADSTDAVKFTELFTKCLSLEKNQQLMYATMVLDHFSDININITDTNRLGTPYSPVSAIFSQQPMNMELLDELVTRGANFSFLIPHCGNTNFREYCGLYLAQNKDGLGSPPRANSQYTQAPPLRRKPQKAFGRDDQYASRKVLHF